MARFLIPNALSPPEPARLARVIQHDDDSLVKGPHALPNPTVGEVVNVTSALPDGSLLYCVSCPGPEQGDGALVREGWLTATVVDELETTEASAVPAELRLTGANLYKRMTLVRANEEWQDFDQDPATLRLIQGEFLQVSAVKNDQWAYGWSLACPSRRGWFPVFLVVRLDSSLSSLIPEIEKELSETAHHELKTLLLSVPKPPYEDTVSDDEDVPPLVAESAQRLEKEWAEKWEQIDAAERVNQAAPQDDAKAANAEGETAQDDPHSVANLFAENARDDEHPLFVCNLQHRPAATMEAQLQLELGDLIRVTTQPTNHMLFGFLEDKPQMRGWFPRANVVLIEDPLGFQPPNSSKPKPPPLPELPKSLAQRQLGKRETF